VSAESADDLVDRHDAVAVAVAVAVAAQSARQGRQDLAPSRPQEVVLDVGTRESGIKHHAAFTFMTRTEHPADPGGRWFWWPAPIRMLAL
jgi:hypothetical protein